MTSPTWWEVDPARLLLEHSELERRWTGFTVALEDPHGVVFKGCLTATLPRVAAARLALAIRCPAGFPAMGPKVVDVAGCIPPDRRGSHHWHVNPDGSVCFADPTTWSPQYTVADLVDKVADWLVNTVALEAGVLDRMPATGRADLSGAEVKSE